MSDAIPLPPRPHLGAYKKLAKDLQKACKAKDPGAIGDWAARWMRSIARLHGSDVPIESRGRWLEFATQRLVRRWREAAKVNRHAARCALAGAQLFVAREHGFASWPRFARHVEGLVRARSPVSAFEAAADAIVRGDTATLDRLLKADPELVRARSTREHRSTLLHYVSANGIEDFRQKTPKNVVEITKRLLDAGADVKAESDAYGGRSTTLGLAATSCHPEEAGVQIPLLELLIDRGAAIDGPDGGSAVNGCLHNGRGDAAEYLARRGARLDLEGAAGVGRLDVVRTCFTKGDRLRPPATKQQMKDGFSWACEFGRTNVVEFLLRAGMDVRATLKHDGQTGLHWAAYGGHAGVVELLLRRGAPIDVKDESYGGTPLEWALYAWGNSAVLAERGDHYRAVALLSRAGARLDPRWHADDEERTDARKRVSSDPKMQAALRGEAAS